MTQADKDERGMIGIGILVSCRRRRRERPEWLEQPGREDCALSRAVEGRQRIR